MKSAGLAQSSLRTKSRQQPRGVQNERQFGRYVDERSQQRIDDAEDSQSHATRNRVTALGELQ